MKQVLQAEMYHAGRAVRADRETQGRIDDIPPTMGGPFREEMQEPRRAHRPLDAGSILAGAAPLAELDQPREQIAGSVVDLFRSRWWWIGALYLLALVQASVMAVLNSAGHPLLGALVFGVGLFMGKMAVKLLPASAIGIVIGVDGIVVRGRFIRYSKMRAVRQDCHHDAGGRGAIAHNRWSVSLDLVDGERVHVASGFSEGLKDREMAELGNLIEEARATWVEGRHGPGADDDLVERGEKSGAEWLHALRGLGAARKGSYRAAGVEIEQIDRLVNDPRTTPSARAAAAVVLASSGDESAPKRLRIAAEAIANTRVRVAMERVADARDDAAIARALEELHEADREARTA